MSARTAKEKEQAKREFLSTCMLDNPAFVLGVTRYCPDCGIGENKYMVVDKHLMTCMECGFCVVPPSYGAKLSSETPAIKEAARQTTRFIEVLNEVCPVQTPCGSPLSVVDIEDLRRHITGKPTFQSVLRAIRKHQPHLEPHALQITHGLSRVALPKLTWERRGIILDTFKRIIGCYKQFQPETRTGFLSYSYVLYQIMRIMDTPQDILDTYFHTLKGRAGNKRHDSVWQKICGKLALPYLDTAPNCASGKRKDREAAPHAVGEKETRLLKKLNTLEADYNDFMEKYRAME